mmetsp:Transcript_12118/g.18148  ORF Transcript_12118/g.18148 Transcript_12118/m.18148 type:complete len:435 (-) Transcript_12118:107-1411(-)
MQVFVFFFFLSTVRGLCIFENNSGRVSPISSAARIMRIGTYFKDIRHGSRMAHPANADAQSNSKPLLQLKILALLALVVQNSGLTIAMRMSRISKSPTNLYSASTAVAVSEFLKTFLCVLSFCYSRRKDSTSILQSLEIARKESFGDWKDTMRVAVPSGLYVLQNNLQYLATSNLPAEVYQVLIQMKLIATALFSMKILNKFQSTGQWICIGFLTIGLAIVQLSCGSVKLENVNLLIGLTSVFFSCLTSGYAGTYHEVTLKAKNASLIVRNIQMSSISLVLALIGCFRDSDIIMQKGFFHGYDSLVLLVIFLQAVGGLIISVVVKYTDSVVKGIATSASIILSCLLSSLLIRDFQMNSQFFMGATIVCMSALGYSISSMKKPVSNTYFEPKETSTILIAEKEDNKRVVEGFLTNVNRSAAQIMQVQRENTDKES